ncbi:hypothetical protein [Agromyces mariniharenae]|uniref:DUF3558 domain-containing protein n=1 Tax=Agromyces mariniharenae TaxID=2604423 RepID=A0A5S4V7D2_9MICO|nr:hypothetical protein [Agromyces mariniharenae]TYL54018.1 hypothetical protein FYC51_10500 [Agromyces mariniharenae]
MKRNVLEQVAREADATKRSRSTHRIIGLGVGVTLLLGVGAGAAFALGIVPTSSDDVTPSSAAAASASPTPTPEPTPTPPPVDYEVTAGQPASRLGLDCETLVDPAVIESLFTSAVAATDPLVTASEIGASIPRRTSILSVGGTVCEWSNGEANNDQYGTSDTYVGVAVSVMPRPAEGWSDRAVSLLDVGDYSTCDDFGCRSSAEVGDAWVTVEAFGGESKALIPGHWQPLVDAVAEAVSSAGPATEYIAPDRAGAPFPETCESMMPLDVVASIAGTSVEPTGGGGWSEWAEARLQARNFSCGWTEEGGVGRGGALNISWVRDGRWAFDRMLLAGTTSPVELTGLRSSDAAVIRCFDTTSETYCGVDLRVGQDWLNVTASGRDQTIRYAEALLAQLAS